MSTASLWCFPTSCMFQVVVTLYQSMCFRKTPWCAVTVFRSRCSPSVPLLLRGVDGFPSSPYRTAEQIATPLTSFLVRSWLPWRLPLCSPLLPQAGSNATEGIRCLNGLGRGGGTGFPGMTPRARPSLSTGRLLPPMLHALPLTQGSGSCSRAEAAAPADPETTYRLWIQEVSDWVLERCCRKLPGSRLPRQKTDRGRKPASVSLLNVPGV